MAPEFFIYFVFLGLAIFVLIGFIGGAISLIATIYSKRNRRSWKKIAIVWFSLAFVVQIPLFIIGRTIRQRDFLDEPFVGACGQGNMEQVQEFLARGASVDAYGVDFCETALIAATKNGHPEVVELLLSRGANINLPDSRGRTALQYAQESENKEIIALLERFD